MWGHLAEDETEHIRYFKYLKKTGYSLNFSKNNPDSFTKTLKYLKGKITQYSERFKDGDLTPEEAFKKTVSVELKVLVSPLQELYHSHDIILKESILNPKEKYDLHLQRIIDRIFIFFKKDSVIYNTVDAFQKIRENQKRVIRKSKTDKLTGMKSRQYLFENGKFLLDLSRRQKKPVGIIVIDVDNFKDINDSYGHNRGDRVLQKIGKCLRKSVRKSDIAARTGGDEFVLLLYDQTEKEVKKVMERIKKEVDAASVKVSEKNLNIYPRISVGYTVYNSYSEPPELKRFIDEADRMMYENKKSKNTRSPGS